MSHGSINLSMRRHELVRILRFENTTETLDASHHILIGLAMVLDIPGAIDALEEAGKRVSENEDHMPPIRVYPRQPKFIFPEFEALFRKGEVV